MKINHLQVEENGRFWKKMVRKYTIYYPYKLCVFYKKYRISSPFGVKNRPYFQVLKNGLFRVLKIGLFFGDPENRPFFWWSWKYPIFGVLKMTILGGSEFWAFSRTRKFTLTAIAIFCHIPLFFTYPKKRLYKIIIII